MNMDVIQGELLYMNQLDNMNEHFQNILSIHYSSKAT